MRPRSIGQDSSCFLRGGERSHLYYSVLFVMESGCDRNNACFNLGKEGQQSLLVCFLSLVLRFMRGFLLLQLSV